jgi:hypothetical protein
MNSIYSQKAYNVYQQRAPLPLNEYGLKLGRLTINDTLNEFDRLSSAASAQPSGGNALNYASRDLCLNKGEMDNFDFCTELTNASVGPYTMDCLQKAFLRAGGQKNGLMYPSPSSMSRWNSFATWKDVLLEMQNLRAKSGSSDKIIKFNAIKQFIDANTPDPGLLPESITFSRSNIIGNFSITQNYTLEFDITPKGIVGGWGSIFHFTSNGNNCCTLGERSPAIWFIPGQLGLYVRIGDTGDGNWGFDNLAGCQVGKKSHITLKCRGKSVTLTVDTNVYKLIQPASRYKGPVTVFASDPWHDIPNATIENINFKNLGNN